MGAWRVEEDVGVFLLPLGGRWLPGLDPPTSAPAIFYLHSYLFNRFSGLNSLFSKYLESFLFTWLSPD